MLLQIKLTGIESETSDVKHAMVLREQQIDSLDLVKHFTGGITLDYSAENCGKCHSEAHHPYYEEWSQSGHALSAKQSFIVNNPECVKCHVAQSFIAFAKDPDNYKPEILATGQDIQPLTCVACHDPHSNKNIHQLRFPIEAGTRVICDQCHTTDIDSVDINTEPHHTTSECLSGSKEFRISVSGRKISKFTPYFCSTEQMCNMPCSCIINC